MATAHISVPNACPSTRSTCTNNSLTCSTGVHCPYLCQEAVFEHVPASEVSKLAAELTKVKQLRALRIRKVEVGEKEAQELGEAGRASSIGSIAHCRPGAFVICRGGVCVGHAKRAQDPCNLLTPAKAGTGLSRSSRGHWASFGAAFGNFFKIFNAHLALKTQSCQGS